MNDQEGTYDSNIRALQEKLERLELEQNASRVQDDVIVRPKDPVKRRLEPQALTVRQGSQEGESDDSATEELTSPLLLEARDKVMGLFRRIQDEDDIRSLYMDRHPGHVGLATRRRSDPGRITLSPLYTPRPCLHSGSDSGEESDSRSEDRSPRTRSPRRSPFGYLYEGEALTPPFLHGEGRPPGWVSPRRSRLLHTRYSGGAGAGSPSDDMCTSPRRGRTKRSMSLPLPERAALGIGEAIGAIAHQGADSTPPPMPLPPPAPAPTLLKPSQIFKRGRCVSIEESGLEAILEEAGVQKPQPRRFSVPNTTSS